MYPIALGKTFDHFKNDFFLCFSKFDFSDGNWRQAEA